MKGELFFWLIICGAFIFFYAEGKIDARRECEFKNEQLRFELKSLRDSIEMVKLYDKIK